MTLNVASCTPPRLTLIALCLIFVLAGALNATLIFDDGYLVERYQRIASQHTLGETFRILFFVLDLRGAEYRLYGLSKILHFGLWEIAGAHAWVYGAFIAGTQFASGIGIHRVLRHLQANSVQATAVAATWILSPFSVTACFHHYSYLLLPYQITIACALVLLRLQEDGASILRCRLMLAGFGFVLVSTGDSHLPAAVAILTLITFSVSSRRSWRYRLVDLLVVFSAMAATLVFHRWSWSVLTAPFHPASQRYMFLLPSWHDGADRTIRVIRSLALGVTAQVGPLLSLAGPWAIATGIVVALLSVWVSRSKWAAAVGGRRGLAVAFALIFVTSVVTVWLLSTLTNQVSVVLPRRYGYVPYTIAAMSVVAFFSGPTCSARFGRAPTFVSTAIVVWLWLTLTAVCLPIVRTQDAKVWAAAAKAMRQRSDASILFVNTWEHFERPGYINGVGTGGLRGRNFPEIFESPFSNDWWESQYAVAVLGARVAAYRFHDESSSLVQLTGNDVNANLPIVVPRKSVVVLADLSLQPSEFPKTRNRISVFSNWGEFERTVAAHNGATVETGWSSFLLPPAPTDVQINFGRTGFTMPGMLPDKRFQDPSPTTTGLVANYGIEEGAGALYGSPEGGPLGYFLSNRHGAFTYRIDFADQSPKFVALDLLELWHDKAGSRPMIIDAAFDTQWFNVAKAFDPGEWAINAPVTIKLFPGNARTLRVRLAPTPGAADIPFLDGLRVIPVPR